MSNNVPLLDRRSVVQRVRFHNSSSLTLRGLIFSWVCVIFSLEVF